MEEINLKDLIQMLLRKWWIIAVCSMAIAIGTGLWSYYMLVPVYEANTTLYIGKNTTDQDGQLKNDLDLGTLLISDYRELAKSRIVASTVIKELGLSGMSVSAMTNKIGVGRKGDTRVIQISVDDTNRQMAMIIANKVAEVFQKKVVEIMQIENVQVIDKAEMPKRPIYPNKTQNVMIAFIIGLAIGAGIVLLIEFLDDTIKTPDDVSKYANLPVLGTIPVFSNKGRRS